MGTGGVFFLCCLSSYSGHDPCEDTEEAEFWGLAPLCLSMTLKQERDWERHIPQNRGHSRVGGNLESLQQAKGQCIVTTAVWCYESFPSQQGDNPGVDWGRGSFFPKTMA